MAMRGGPRNNPRGPGIGHLEGVDLKVNNDGSVNVKDPSNPANPTRIEHGGRIKGVKSGEEYIWDAHLRHFHNASGVPHLVHKSAEDLANEAELKEMRTLIETIPHGTVGGHKVWTDKNNRAVVNVSDDPNHTQLETFNHGDLYEYKDASGVDHKRYWDATQKLFIDHSPLKEQVKKGALDAFSTDAEKKTATDALTTKLTTLMTGINNPSFKKKLEGLIAKVTKPSEAQALDKHFDEIAPHIQRAHR